MIPLALLLVLAPSPETQAPATYTVVSAGKTVAFEAALDAMGRADVVFVGEQHDHTAGHVAQLAVLKGTHARSKRTGLALEMFECDVQTTLDEYLKGYITESAFLQASRPWPNYKPDYRPMVEYCREQKLSVTASNVPRRYVNMVSRKGQAELAKLPRASRRWLPRLPYHMDMANGYHDALSELFGANHGPGAPAGMPTPEHMIQAQGLWDQGMADSVFRARRGGAKPVVHMNGSMHSDHGWAIAGRVGQKNSALKVVVVKVVPEAAPEKVDPAKWADVADYVIFAAANPPVKAAAPGK